MTEEITVEVRNVFGTVKYYPKCDTAKKLADIAGTVTLTPQALNTIRSMGYNIKLKQQNLEGEFV